jgi:hypothetical protein
VSRAGANPEVAAGADAIDTPPGGEFPAVIASESAAAEAPPDDAPDPLGSEIDPSAGADDPLAPILEEAGGWPEGPSPRAIDDWFADSETTFEGFDLPGPGELVTEEPAGTGAASQDEAAPVENEFVEDDPAPVENGFVEDEPRGDSVPVETNGLLTSAPSQGAEALLASADDLGDIPLGEPARKRVEDDERVTKGLINRLIEGLKGL